MSMKIGFVAGCFLLLLLVACARESVPQGMMVRLQDGALAISDGGRCIQDDVNAVIYPSTVRAVDLGAGEDGKRRLWMQYENGTEKIVPLG